MTSDKTGPMWTGIRIDRQIKGSMPDKWTGHSRLQIADRDNLSEIEKKAAIKLAKKINQRSDKTFAPEALAESCIEKVVERMREE